MEEPCGPSLEEVEGTKEDRESEFLHRLQGLVDSEEPKKALILKNSHVGGHKFSGNVVVRLCFVLPWLNVRRLTFVRPRFIHLEVLGSGTAV